MADTLTVPAGSGTPGSSPAAIKKKSRAHSRAEEIEMEPAREDQLRSEYAELLGMMEKTSGMAEDVEVNEQPSGFTIANIFSRICFFWMFPFVMALRRGEITAENLTLKEKDRTSASTRTFKAYWASEITSDNPSLLRAIRKSFYPKFIRAVVLKLTWGAVMVFLNTFIINRFIYQHRLYALKRTRLTDWWLLATVIFLLSLALGFLLHHMESMAVRIGIRIRSAMVACIYEKSLTAEVTNFAISPILSLLTKDCATLLQAPVAFIRLTTGILELFALIGVLYKYINNTYLWWIIIVTFIIIPVQYILGERTTYIRQSNTASNDQRLLIVHEVLYAIKLVKFYTWEESFAKKIQAFRRNEIRLLCYASIVKAWNILIMIYHHILSFVGIFYINFKAGNKPLVPWISFTLVNAANSFRFPLFYFPVAIKIVYESHYAIKRIQAFLLETDLNRLPESDDYGAYFRKAIFTHTTAKDSPIMEGEDRNSKKSAYAKRRDAAKNKKMAFYMKNITMEVRKGEVLAVIGPFGSGKSTIAQAIIGDVQVLSGYIGVKGRIAYVPQTPWIMHGTIRDNILFGRPFDHAWYLKVVRNCSLIPDLRQMKEYDLTYLSEGGINLSGGQRQRLALARAVYAQADIYILDSVLSALDPETARIIFRRVVKGLLKTSATVLITHNLAAIPHCDKLMVMNDGECAYYGPYDAQTVMDVFPEARKELAEAEEGESKGAAGGKKSKIRSDSTSERSDQLLSKMLKASKFKIAGIAEEGDEEEKGADKEVLTDKQAKEHKSLRSKKHGEDDDDKAILDISLAKAIYYWSTYAGIFIVLFQCLFYVTAQSVRNYMDFWIRYWLNNTLKKSDDFYINWLMGLFGIFGGSVLFRNILWYLIAVRAAYVVHEKFFAAIVHAPMLYFSQEPLGRILKAYSKDQDQVDDGVPDATQFTLFWGSISLTTIGSLCFVHKLFIPAFIVIVFSWLGLQWWFTRPVNICKDAVGKTDGVFLVHASETLHGMHVIRAYGVENVMLKENEICLDAYGTAVFHLEHITLWMALWFDIIAAVYMFYASAIIIVKRQELTTAQSGQIIAGSTQLLVFLAMTVNTINDAQYQFFAVARILHYILKTPIEDFSYKVQVPETNGKPNFPRGAIDIYNADMAYDPMKGLVLKNLSVSIAGAERVGIVGRTGSGKSSLINAIFRLTELSNGRIEIDNIVIRDVPIKDLRRALSIIPQEPVVFRGTIRSNIDPFNEYKDEEMINALKASHLWDLVEAMPGQLDSEVAEGGGNMSLGQKQLLCLTRVVLRKERRILVLDEATSALDPVTDQLMQQSVRAVFDHHTILTIAHRLDTIIDYDKILVLGHGEKLEFGTVKELLAKEGGHFRKMYEGDGPDSKEEGH